VANSYLHASGLPAAWASQNAWRILDTHWQDEKRFRACIDAWDRDPLQPRMLHYVGLVTDQSNDLPPGFHRLSFNAGHVLLTLCVGELKLMLRAQDFRADSIFLSQRQSPAWDDWTIQALLRCCRRGTQLATSGADVDLLLQLTQYGFDIQTDAAPGFVQARFNPRWQIKSTRRQPASPIVQPSNCVVIGAGLAGASTAASLARRGWQVQVLDAAASPASATSGLPLGLIAPPLGGDHDARSDLLKDGIRLTLQQAQEQLKRGQDWAPTGIMTTQPGRAAQWEPLAAWIKPHRLVQAWLAQPGIQFRGTAQVASMSCVDGEWILRNAQNAVLAQSGLVVLACAGGSEILLDGSGMSLRQPLASIQGQVSWALQRASDLANLPPFPLNGFGHLVPDVPLEAGSAWFAGATYVLDDVMPAVSDGHNANLARLTQLHPPSAQVMEARISDGSIQAWQGTRWATQDRMPLVGRLNVKESANDLSMLCINSGYGSRGLSWSVLCAELLAAQIGNEPLPMPHARARLLRGGR
jgi:tRNA 5-methylaminomethyl-2-thiouridine biosynthesis bifunctional protein